MSKRIGENILDWMLELLTAMIICILIIEFVGQISFVRKTSMLPTLNSSDVLIIEKIKPALHRIGAGDIVMIKNDHYANDANENLIKRVIAVGGDKIELKNGKVWVNGIELVERYIKGTETGPVEKRYSNMTVPSGTVYVMGDNRIAGESLDSRTFGPVSLQDVKGTAIFRIYPFDKMGSVK